MDLSRPTILVAYHPVTLLRDTTAEAGALFEALDQVGAQFLFCFPNADAGSHSLIERTRLFLSRHNTGKVFVNLDSITYWSLLPHVQMLLGNSSSGIMETASFALPTVNVGMRQQGRERARNVIDSAPIRESIVEAISQARSSAFRESLKSMTNPYGDGHASERILRVLTTTPLSEELLIKRAVHPLAETAKP